MHEILNFYSNYHSSRYVADKLVLRLRRPPTPEQLDALNRDFAELLGSGSIEVSGPLAARERASSPSTRASRLRIDHREMGLLRELIDVLNGYVAASAPPPRDAGPVEMLEQQPAARGRARRAGLAGAVEFRGTRGRADRCCSIT